MIALDTNILVYAFRADQSLHQRARSLIEALAIGNDSWTVPSACEMEFIATITNSKLFDDALSLLDAVVILDRLSTADSFLPIYEHPGWRQRMVEIVAADQPGGQKLYDARIAAICLDNGVSELWTNDHSFGDFPGLKCVNPFKSPTERVVITH